jgi:hypothetical protein
MSKQLIRIKSKDLTDQLNALVGIEIHIVLENGITFLGALKGIELDKISFVDARKHAHQYAISDIYEVVYDTKKATKR